jgi:uncharacterized protein (DUF488 family)
VIAMQLYTIGHSNHPSEKFLHLLEENRIALLVDVRSAPYSRYNLQFNKESLEHTLSIHHIKYIYAGKHLGGRPTDLTCFKGGKLPDQETNYLHEVNYPEVMKRPWFQKGIERLLELAEKQTTAILCSEEDPTQCHRHHLITKYLMNEYPDWKIWHIRGDENVINAASIHLSVNQPAGEQPSLC